MNATNWHHKEYVEEKKAHRNQGLFYLMLEIVSIFQRPF
jgi:hypothetical protein